MSHHRLHRLTPASTASIFTTVTKVGTPAFQPAEVLSHIDGWVRTACGQAVLPDATVDVWAMGLTNSMFLVR
jgi:hypothetical protein